LILVEVETMRTFLRALAVLALAVAALSPAAAAETGTPAWTTTAMTVFEGPGAAYDIVGDVEEAIHLRVERCTYRWCRIRTSGAHGWVSRDQLNFGQHARGPFTGPRLNYKSGGPGTVCFFSGRSYSGESFCVGSGHVVHDLLLLDRDNRYSSITVEGEVSVMLCRDRDFSSHCERFNESTPRLPGFLDNAVSSYHVY